ARTKRAREIPFNLLPSRSPCSPLPRGRRAGGRTFGRARALTRVRSAVAAGVNRPIRWPEHHAFEPHNGEHVDPIVGKDAHTPILQRRGEGRGKGLIFPAPSPS